MELTLALTKQWMKLFAEKIEANKAYLSDLDTPIGDGDHGWWSQGLLFLNGHYCWFL